MQCVILAGGRGTRMLPATREVPKTLLPVAGEPFVAHQLRLLGRNGIDRVVFSIGHLGALIREFVGDGERFGLDVAYVDEGESLRGTGGALRLAADAGVLDDHFFVTYGDAFLPTDYGAIHQSFVASGAAALMTVFRNDGKWIPSNAVFKDGWVTLYDKQPAVAITGMSWVDYGISILTRNLVETEISANETIDLSDVFGWLSHRSELAGFEVHERFYEIGSPQGLKEIEVVLVSGESRR